MQREDKHLPGMLWKDFLHSEKIGPDEFFLTLTAFDSLKSIQASHELCEVVERK